MLALSLPGLSSMTSTSWFPTTTRTTTNDVISRGYPNESCTRSLLITPHSTIESDHSRSLPSNSSWTMIFLNRFNRAKLRNLHLNLGHEESCEVDEVAKKALEVISQSVYLDSMTITFHSGLMFEQCEMFLRELRQIVPRMRRFCFVCEIRTDGLKWNRLRMLRDEIMTVVDHAHSKEGESLMFMIWAITSSRASSSLCSLRVLSKDVVRHLHQFLIE